MSPTHDHTTATDGLDDPLSRLVRLLEPVIEVVQECASHVEAALAPADRVGGRARTTDLNDLLEPMAARLGRASRLIDGLGFGVEPGVLEGVDHYLAWWRRDSAGAPRLLPLSFEDRPDSYGHYPDAEWFRAPARTGQARLAGPYIDQGATDELTYNYAVPVMVPYAARPVAVASADLVAEALERAAQTVLMAWSRPAAILSQDDRVIASSTTALTVGTIVVAGPPVVRLRPRTDFGWTLVAVDDDVTRA